MQQSRTLTATRLRCGKWGTGWVAVWQESSIRKVKENLICRLGLPSNPLLLLKCQESRQQRQTMQGVENVPGLAINAKTQYAPADDKENIHAIDRIEHGAAEDI